MGGAPAIRRAIIGASAATSLLLFFVVFKSPALSDLERNADRSAFGAEKPGPRGTTSAHQHLEEVAQSGEEIGGWQTSGWKHYFTHATSICIVAAPKSDCPRALVADALLFATTYWVSAPENCKDLLVENPGLTNNAFANATLHFQNHLPQLDPPEYSNCETLILVLPEDLSAPQDYLTPRLFAPPSVSHVLVVPFGWSFTQAAEGGKVVTPRAAELIGGAVDKFLVCHAEWKVLVEPLVALQPPPHVWFLLRYRLHDSAKAQLLSDRFEGFHRLQKAAACPVLPGQKPLPSCDNRKYMVYSMHSHGFGAVVRSAGWYMMAAHYFNRTFVVKRKSGYLYADQRECPDNDFSCTFVGRESECSDWAHEQLRVGTPNEATWQAFHTGDNYTDQQQFWLVDTAHGNPEEFAMHRRWPLYHALGWQPAHQYADYLTVPNYRTRKAIGEKIARLKLPRHYIGAHVRHGDKAREVALIPFKRYMHFATRFRQVSGIRAIYIATDNQTVLDTARQIYPEFDFYHVDFDRIGSKGLQAKGFVSSNELKDRGKLFLDLWTDLTVLMNSDFFLGSFESGFTGLVVEKRLAADGVVIQGLMLGGGKEQAANSATLRSSLKVQAQHFP